ncbi:hypothetical protein ACOSQ3_006589 [Xanthoceras sorbifolium]
MGAVMAFTEGLRDGRLSWSLSKNGPSSYRELMERMEKHATTEEISRIKGKNEEAQPAEPKRPWYNRLSKKKAKAPEKDDRVNVGQNARGRGVPGVSLISIPP